MAVPFPMIGDADGAIARAWGVVWPLWRRARRVTFVVDARGVVRGVFDHEILIDRHVVDVLGAVRGLAGRGGAV